MIKISKVDSKKCNEWAQINPIIVEWLYDGDLLWARGQVPWALCDPIIAITRVVTTRLWLGTSKRFFNSSASSNHSVIVACLSLLVCVNCLFIIKLFSPRLGIKPVWPDIEIKSSQKISKRSPKVTTLDTRYLSYFWMKIGCQ